MSNEKGMERIKEMLLRCHCSDDSIELLVPIIAGLLDHCHIEKVAVIVKELLNDDPLVNRITKIYEEGSTLWFALKDKE